MKDVQSVTIFMDVKIFDLKVDRLVLGDNDLNVIAIDSPVNTSVIEPVHIHSKPIKLNYV